MDSDLFVGGPMGFPVGQNNTLLLSHLKLQVEFTRLKEELMDMKNAFYEFMRTQGTTNFQFSAKIASLMMLQPNSGNDNMSDQNNTNGGEEDGGVWQLVERRRRNRAGTGSGHGGRSQNNRAPWQVTSGWQRQPSNSAKQPPAPSCRPYPRPPSATPGPRGASRPSQMNGQRQNELQRRHQQQNGHRGAGFWADGNGTFRGVVSERQPPNQQPGRPKKVHWTALPRHEVGDKSYNDFWQEIQTIEERGVVRPVDCKMRLEKRHGDIFYAEEGFKAEAIAADRGMRRGVACHWRNVYGERPQPASADQPVAPGMVLESKVRGRGYPSSTWLHMVTKTNSSERLQDTKGVFVEGAKAGFTGLAEYCRQHQVKRLAMTYVCTGLDGMPPRWVDQQLINAFSSQDITLVIYLFRPNAAANGRRDWRHQQWRSFETSARSNEEAREQDPRGSQQEVLEANSQQEEQMRQLLNASWPPLSPSPAPSASTSEADSSLIEAVQQESDEGDLLGFESDEEETDPKQLEDEGQSSASETPVAPPVRRSTRVRNANQRLTQQDF